MLLTAPTQQHLTVSPPSSGRAGGQRACSITSRRWSQPPAECGKLQHIWPGPCNCGNKVSGAEREAQGKPPDGGTWDASGQYMCHLLGSPSKNKIEGETICRSSREAESTGWVLDAVLGLFLFGGATMIRLKRYLFEIYAENLQSQCYSILGLLQNTTGAGRGSNKEETRLAVCW